MSSLAPSLPTRRPTIKAPPPPSPPPPSLPSHRTARSCRLYDEHGLIVETSTHLEDIVMSDYFQIDDRCVVQPGEDGSGVRIDVEIEVSVTHLVFMLV